MNWRTAVRITVVVGVALGAAGTAPVVRADPPSIGYRPGWPVDTGKLIDRSSPAVGNLDADDDLEIVIGTRGRQVYAFNPDGSLVPGWPAAVSAEVNSSPAIGDINGDGYNEVVVGVGWQDLDNDGGIYAFSRNGQLLPGWPVRTQDRNVRFDGHPDGVFASPALADLDDDGRLDIIVPAFDQMLYALRYDGTPMAGHWPFFMYDSSWSSPAVADLDGDGDLEVVIGAYAHAGFPPGLPTVDGGGIAWVLNARGEVEPGWPRVFDLHFDSSPALGDLDGDGDLEIIIGTGHELNDARGHHVYAWHHDGQDVAGWPVSTQEYVWPSPALGDLDGDGQVEVVVSCADGYLYAWDGNGNLAWKVQPLNESGLNGGMVGSPVIADLDGNGDLEVVTPIGWDLVAFNHDGSPFRYGSEPQMRLHTLFTLGSTPTVADLDGNGRLDVLIGSAERDFNKGRLYAWELPAAAVPGKWVWPMFRHDPRRTGKATGSPRLAVEPAGLALWLEYGQTSWTGHIAIVNTANEGEIMWQAIISPSTALPHPPAVAILPSSGTAEARQTVAVTVKAAGYPTGTYSLGQIIVAGAWGGKAVPGSPAPIPITVHVGKLYRVFLPLAAENARGAP